MQNTSRMTNVTVRMDAELKKKAEQLYDELGLNMSVAINMFTKAVVREGRIPFDIKLDPFYSPENQAELRRRVADLEAGRNVRVRELIEVDDE